MPLWSGPSKPVASIVLPPEIWLEILGYLPRSAFHSFRHLNAVLWNLYLDGQYGTLDLAAKKVLEYKLGKKWMTRFESFDHMFQVYGLSCISHRVGTITLAPYIEYATGTLQRSLAVPTRKVNSTSSLRWLPTKFLGVKRPVTELVPEPLSKLDFQAVKARAITDKIQRLTCSLPHVMKIVVRSLHNVHFEQDVELPLTCTYPYGTLSYHAQNIFHLVLDLENGLWAGLNPIDLDKDLPTTLAFPQLHTFEATFGEGSWVAVPRIREILSRSTTLETVILRYPFTLDDNSDIPLPLSIPSGSDTRVNFPQLRIFRFSPRPLEVHDTDLLIPFINAYSRQLDTLNLESGVSDTLIPHLDLSSMRTLQIRLKTNAAYAGLLSLIKAPNCILLHLSLILDSHLASPRPPSSSKLRVLQLKVAEITGFLSFIASLAENCPHLVSLDLTVRTKISEGLAVVNRAMLPSVLPRLPYTGYVPAVSVITSSIEHAQDQALQHWDLFNLDIQIGAIHNAITLWPFMDALAKKVPTLKSFCGKGHMSTGKSQSEG